jgi:hypothetical protein
VSPILNRRRQRTPAAPERILGAALAGGRIAIGAGIWMAPSLTARALGMATWHGESLAVARLAATRDLILGAWLAAELRDGGKPLAPAVALTACDAGDALAFSLLATRDSEPGPGLRGVAAAGPTTLAGGWLVSRLRHTS